MAPNQKGQPMDFFFKPRGIALIGATASQMKGGYSILKNLTTGYQGQIYPVNPRYQEIEGLTCYDSVRKVPDPVDLAIIFVPAPAAVRAVRDCAERGIKGVMVQSAGFSETGENGKALQDEMIRIKKETGIRVWGPNCMGLVDAVNRHVFSFVLPVIWDDGLMPGDVSLIVQSGMLSAGFLIDTVTHGTMGISKACSIGNKADVNECDILEYLIDDPHTRVIGAYLESIIDGTRFLSTCKKTDKPIVILKGGKSDKGAEAAMSHTASLAGNDAIVRDALAQVSVVEADDFKQMLDLCRTLAAYDHIALQGKSGIAVVTYSGGAGIVSTDFMDQMGLEAAQLSKETIGLLEQIYPDWMPPANPVDLWPAIEKNGPEIAYKKAFEAVCSDPGVDAVLYHVFIGGKVRKMDVAPLADIAGKYHKPVFIWLLGNRPQAYEFQMHAQSLGIPVYRELYRAVECMAAYVKYKKSRRTFKQRTALPALKLSPFCSNMMTQEGKSLDEYISKKIFFEIGIPVVKERIAETTEDAVKAGRDVGYPVVLKGLLPEVIHKTEQNLIRLNLQSDDDVAAACDELRHIMGDQGKILVQQQITGGPELIAGLVRDPQFGTCVMCGLGGVLTEIVDDKAFAAAPFDIEEALTLIDRLKTQKLLNGYRSFPALDRSALAEILVRLFALGNMYPNIREIDINPMIVQGGIPVAVDATIILDEQ
jgi:acetyltransferase